MIGPTEVTEELFDAIAAPILAAAAMSMLEVQLEALSDVEPVLRDNLANWDPVMRQRASEDLRACIEDVRRHLDRIEAALPEDDS